MFKFIGKLLFLISMYELGKYVTNEILVRLDANDDIDVPLDFVKTDHLHLNKIWILSWEGIKYENNWRP